MRTWRSASGPAAPCAPSPVSARRTRPPLAAGRSRAGNQARPRCPALPRRAPPRAARRRARGTAWPRCRGRRAAPPPGAPGAGPERRPASRTRPRSTRRRRAASGSGHRPTGARTRSARHRGCPRSSRQWARRRRVRGLHPLPLRCRPARPGGSRCGPSRRGARRLPASPRTRPPGPVPRARPPCPLPRGEGAGRSVKQASVRRYRYEPDGDLCAPAAARPATGCAPTRP
jgi:hypothetical protein